MTKEKIKKTKKNKNNINKKVNYILGGIFILALIGIGGYCYFYPDESPIKKNILKPDIKEEKKLQIVDLESKTRPYAVMINNIGAARPLQSGLQDAFIIYEMIVEGGLTRYLALFMDVDVERIGSVRSARHYYLDYALENDAFYVHHGQSPQAQAQFSSLGIHRIVVDDSKTGWRDKKLGKNVDYEHTLFTSTEKLKNGIGNKRIERNKNLLLNYSIEAINFDKYEGALVANNVNIEYSNNIKSSYKFDIESKTYKRFVNDKEHIDYVTEKQYTFKNIIIYQVRNVSIDSTGRQDIKNVGQGEGYLISNGYAVPITWSKTSRGSQTVYKHLNGEEIIVNDGNTFIQIQPTNKSLIIN